MAKKQKFAYVHKKQSGGAGQYAKIIGFIEPINEDISDPEAVTDNVFVNATTGQNIPNEYIPAIDKAFHDSCKKGPQTGYPVIGVRFTLEDGNTHVVDSSSLAF